MVNLQQLQRESRLPRLEQSMLWEHVLGVSRVWLITHDTDPLPSESVAQYKQLERRRTMGEPMAYLIGWREFMGHRFTVEPSVLIPRPDTETLVEQALLALRGVDRPRVLDLGTGSGAIAISIALARPDAVVIASDYSEKAIQVAQKNAHDLCGKVEFSTGSWYDALNGHNAFDLIVSNPPYISSDDPHLLQGDIRFEPRQALTDGASGLRDLQTIICGGRDHLRPQGQLWVEHGWDQAEQVRLMLHHAGYSSVSSKQDLAGIERVSGGTH